VARFGSHTIGRGLVEKFGIGTHAITIARNDTGVIKGGAQARNVYCGGGTTGDAGAGGGGTVAIDDTGREIALSTIVRGPTARGATRRRLLRPDDGMALLPVHENPTKE
jgi:hypothetical protein